MVDAKGTAGRVPAFGILQRGGKVSPNVIFAATLSESFVHHPGEVALRIAYNAPY